MATKTKSKQKKNGEGRTTDAIYAEVTDTIIKALEEGVVPWQRPWRVEGGMHMNLKSKKPYRGINPFLLDFSAMSNNWTAPFWMTYKQAQEVGAHVQAGEKSTLVTFWKILRVDAKDSNGNLVKDKDGRQVIKPIPLLKYYRVFNAEQIVIDPKANWKNVWKALEGVWEPSEDNGEPFNPIEGAQAIIDLMQKCPAIMHGGDRAFYRPSTDTVTLPEPDQFNTNGDYYCTAYHELVHSTGHETRTARVKDWTSFGSEPYAKEELVAEMGAAMLAGYAQIDMPVKENSAAYIASWLKKLKDDKKFVIQAASKAQQACDYILGTTFGEDDE